MRKRLNCFSLFLIIIALSFLSGSEKAGSPPILLDKTEVSDGNNDIILCGTSFERSTAAIVTAVENGTISQAQIDASVLRILHLKEQLNLNIRVE